MRQIINLDPADNIATIRDKLERVQAPEVIVVAPPRYEVLRNKINLRLLQRYARHKAVKMALVTRDSMTRALAREIGLQTTTNVGSGRQLKLDVPTDGETGKAATTTDRSQETPTHGASLVARILALTLAVAALGALVGAFILLVLPSATIRVYPNMLPLEAEMEITALPSLDAINYGLGQIPAQVISVELESEESAPTTGKRDIADSRAEGMVVFANRTNEAVIVPQGTIVSTSTGTRIRFYTLTDLELPAEQGSHDRVRVIAVEPGPQGNVRQLTITRIEDAELATQVHVINDEATTGGGLRRVNEVSAEDLGRVKNALMQRLQQEAFARLQGELGPNEFIPASSVSVEIVDEQYDHKVGDVADVLTLRLSVIATGNLVGGEDANTLILGLLESRVPENYRLATDTLRFQPPELLPSQEGASGTRFIMRATAIAVTSVTKADILAQITGKTGDQARSALVENWDFRQPPELEITPEWIGRIPWIPYRIQIDINVPVGA